MKHLLLVAVLLVAGCQFGRDTALNLAAEDIKNTEAAKKVAKNGLSTWPVKSGIIKGTLGIRIDELPIQTVDAITGLDELAAKDPNDLTDEELGEVIGLKLRLLSPVVKEILKQFAPDILELLNLIL